VADDLDEFRRCGFAENAHQDVAAFQALAEG
jgi:hypothetical protein